MMLRKTVIIILTSCVTSNVLCLSLCTQSVDGCYDRMFVVRYRITCACNALSHLW